MNVKHSTRITNSDKTTPYLNKWIRFKPIRNYLPKIEREMGFESFARYYSNSSELLWTKAEAILNDREETTRRERVELGWRLLVCYARRVGIETVNEFWGWYEIGEMFIEKFCFVVCAILLTPCVSWAILLTWQKKVIGNGQGRAWVCGRLRARIFWPPLKIT